MLSGVRSDAKTAPLGERRLTRKECVNRLAGLGGRDEADAHVRRSPVAAVVVRSTGHEEAELPCRRKSPVDVGLGMPKIVSRM